MVAAMYLMRDIAEQAPDSDIRLFEGFVSYKGRGERSDHCADVLVLRDVVQDPVRYYADCIKSADDLCAREDRIESAFKVCGTDRGVPPVIKRQRRERPTTCSGRVPSDPPHNGGRDTTC